MAEPFKLLINAGTARRAADALHRAWPAFPRQAFLRHASTGLDALAFKARAMQLADALEASLPADFRPAADIIEASLAPPIPFDALGEPAGLGSGEPKPGADPGLAGWVVWSLAEFVARRGMDDLPRALACLHALTQRFSAEFAIRRFIQRHPGPVFDTLAVWVNDPSAHVRRLVSEGSRPRLPWGLRLHALVADPSPSLPLLRALQDDPSAYVRRSVANHLNDIAKDHPDTVASWVARHRAGASAQREALLRHASRSLIKEGHEPTLAAWGLQPGLQGEATLRLSASSLRIGGTLGLAVQVRSRSAEPQSLIVDYVVHHQGAHGRTNTKVFKGWKILAMPNSEHLLTKQHSLRPVTTRRWYPGPHPIDLKVNGQVVASATFQLLA